MNDFFELEKRCKKLHQKKLIKLILIFIILLLVAVSVFFFLDNKTNKKTIPTQPIKKEIKQPIKHKEIKKHKELNKTKKLIQPKIKPIINSSKKEKNITQLKVEKPIEKNITKIKEKNTTQIKNVELIKEPILNLDIDFTHIVVINSSKNSKKEKNITKIKEKNITKPNQNHKLILTKEVITFKKAYTLALKYYENSDYKNSIKWCKIASNIDNYNENIWKLYALNYEKIGKKDKAIKVLKTYLKYKDSLEIKYLLQRMTK